MHSHLKLQHHRHSGKLLAHHHTSYRALSLVLAMIGVCLFMINSAARAADLIVSAKVSAEIPISPATVDTPADGFTTNNPSIIVAGTCPIQNPGVVVIIYSGPNFLGSMPCSNTGTFSVPVTLLPGHNPIVVKVVNVTGDYGPDSTIVNVYYNPPASINPKSEPPRNTGGLEPTPSNLVIYSLNPYIVFGPLQPAVWKGYFDGGRPPYQVKIDWGDGQSSTYTVRDSSQQAFPHTYQQMRSYFIHLTVTDTDGRSSETTFAAVTPYTNPTVTGSNNGGDGSGFSVTSLIPFDTSFVSMTSLYVLIILLTVLIWIDARYLRLGRLLGVQYAHNPQPRNRNRTRAGTRSKR